jgi:hypothetical protein
MNRVFKNDYLEAEFITNGFVKIPFYTINQVLQPLSEIKKLQPSDGFGAFQKTGISAQSYHCTFFDSNMTYRDQVKSIIHDFYRPFAEEFLSEYKLITANLFLKPAHSGYVYPHQNITITDESKYTSVSLWCPTTFTEKKNGTMEIIPGSHKYFMKYRNTNIHWPLLELMQKTGSEFLKALDVAPGEVVVLDDSIIHTTDTNQTDQDREVLHAMAVPQNAPIWYVDLIDNRVNIYNTNDYFWQQHIPGAAVNFDVPVAQLPYTEHSLSKEEFVNELGKARLNHLSERDNFINTLRCRIPADNETT